jgi:hypothetical protein
LWSAARSRLGAGGSAGRRSAVDRSRQLSRGALLLLLSLADEPKQAPLAVALLSPIVPDSLCAQVMDRTTLSPRLKQTDTDQ